MHEGIEARARLRHDVAAEGGEIVRARIARRHAGGRALVGDQFVRRDSDGRPVRIHMRVQIDEARRHQLAGSIQQFVGARRRNIRLQRLDQPVADADITLAAQRLTRIEHIAALDNQIELVGRPHRGKRRAARRRNQREGSGGSKKIATRRGHDSLPVI